MRLPRRTSQMLNQQTLYLQMHKVINQLLRVELRKNLENAKKSND